MRGLKADRRTPTLNHDIKASTLLTIKASTLLTQKLTHRPSTSVAATNRRVSRVRS